MTEPAEFNPETEVCVVLNGKAWPVPPLVWRDLKTCRKELLEMTALINQAVAGSPAAPADDDVARVARNLGVISNVFQSLSNDDFDRLVMGPIFAGLTAAHPSLPRAEFDNWVLTEADRQMAWLTVRNQSGLFVMRDAATDDGAGEERPMGEARGAA